MREVWEGLLQRQWQPPPPKPGTLCHTLFLASLLHHLHHHPPSTATSFPSAQQQLCLVLDTSPNAKQLSAGKALHVPVPACDWLGIPHLAETPAASGAA